MSFLNRLKYKYFTKFSIKTVHLRGRLSDIEKSFFESFKGKYVFRIKDIKSFFKNANLVNQKVFLEIGFGNGSHLLEIASKHNDNKEIKLLGVEMYEAGVVKVMRELFKNNIENTLLIQEDAREVLEKIENQSLAGVFVLFPDPWPKKRHNKRRLLKQGFIKSLLEKIEIGGELILATDWQDYANEIEIALKNLEKEINIKAFELGDFESKIIKETTFAKRAIKEGRNISIFSYVK